ncbi:MAG TPA: hypothetical protein VGM53_35405 [Streptosporangiaceae bacterium]|jgi:hypothetical protein
MTGLIGNGIALLLAGVAMLIARNRQHVPGGASGEALLTIAIVLMLFSGELSRSTGVGSWILSGLSDVEGWMGPSGATILAIITLAVLLIVGVAVFRNASERALTLAFLLPFGLAMFHSGVFHSLDLTLQAPAQDIAAKVASGLGV